MERVHYKTYYQGQSRIEIWFEWDGTANYPSVNRVAFKDGEFADSKATSLTPEKAKDLVFEHYMNS